MTEQPYIGVIGAMASEIDALKASLENAETVTVSGIDFVSGRLGNVDLVVAQCGIGKVFAALCAQAMIMLFGPSLIVNIGVGGSLTPGLNIADVGIGRAVVQHDMDTSGLGDPVGLISGINRVELPCDEAAVAAMEKAAAALGVHTETGVIASGDLFVSDESVKRRIVDRFSAIVCEMEGGAIAQVCYVNQIPCVILRAVSDNGDSEAERAYTDALQRAADVALAVLKAYLAAL
ncbi:MAG: 5'-methylthioadenosine/adenosylhomocysteine nucleosidase [Oscillospiraceae bacterium]|nr:5'-methylthioadenosine/adenosylhomocysteine nucleosidase [Oscillospiraceae bacterium]